MSLFKLRRAEQENRNAEARNQVAGRVYRRARPAAHVRSSSSRQGPSRQRYALIRDFGFFGIVRSVTLG